MGNYGGGTKGDMLVDGRLEEYSWDIVAWQHDHRISFLGEIGFWGAGPYGRNWLERTDGRYGLGGLDGMKLVWSEQQ